MKRTSISRHRTAFVAGILLLAAALGRTACAQLASLDKGHQLLVNSGLQIWGLNTDSFQYTFNYNNFTAANMNAVMWSHDQSNPGVLSAGQKWGKWVHQTDNPANALNSTEMAHYADLLAIQVGDEQQSDIENPNGFTKAWFNSAHANNLYTDKLLYVNSTFVSNVSDYLNFIASANPDAISWDAYPFGTTGVYPYNWLGKAQIFRRAALGSYIGASSSAARPYGLYLQTYHGGDGARTPGDLEMRWQQFTAWTLGYTFVDAFTAGGGNTDLFVSGNGNDPNEPVYDKFKETSRQSRNLGPALVKLISHGYGPNIVLGKDPSGVTNSPPIDWPVFSPANQPPSQPYLTGVSALNLGTKNNGQPGDVYVGFFNPLLTSYGDPAGTSYFMVTNALGAYLQDPTLTPADCTQQITLDFNFGASSINSLQRLSRNTGQVETVPLTSLGGNNYRYVFNLEGGTGDLFKYNDGSPFVGVQSPPSNTYWDGDGNAANNNVSSGAGLGGNGNWDNAAAKWFNGTSNVTWAASGAAVFTGTAGTVTLSSPQSASSLSFKTDGYTVSGSTLTLVGSNVTVDAGATASITSVIAGTAGLVKNGAGTLALNPNNTYSGGTTISQGVLGIKSASLGANPSSPTVNLSINSGATLRFDVNNLTLNANRQIVLGAGGGNVDTNGNTDTIAGATSGGALIKTGAGTLILTNTNTHSATLVSSGALRVSNDGNLGSTPGAFTAGNLTLNGGTLQFADNVDINNNRGITLGTAGGTIDTQGFSNAAGYNATAGGFQGTGDLTKLGAGTFYAAATTGGLNTTWKGRLIIKEGTWKIRASDGLPYNVLAADGLKADQVTLDGGTWQIETPTTDGVTLNVTNGRRGITVAAGGGTIDTQSYNLTWAGPLAGANGVVLNKTGSGTLTFTGVASASPYSGTINVNGGTLKLNNASAMGPTAAINLADSGGVLLNIAGNVTIGSLHGGGAAGGNVMLGAVTLTTGGNNSSTVFGGVIGGANAALTKVGAGTMELSGANSYTGLTTVAGGRLIVNGSLDGNALVQNNATLAGSGTIGGSATIQSGGTLSPGVSPSTISLGSLTLASGSTLAAEIGPLSDLVNVGGVASLNGTLAILPLSGFVPSLGQEFTLLSAASISGTFSNEIVPTFSALTLDIVYGDQSVVAKVVPVLAGDFNADGAVDMADYVLWRKGGPQYTPDDYNKWKMNYGRTIGGGGSSEANASRVPEPLGEILVITAVFGLCCERRKRGVA